MRRYTHKKVFPYSSLVTQHLLADKVKKHERKHNELDIKPILLIFFWSENINLIDTSKISQSCSITESGWFARSTCVPNCLEMPWKDFVNGTGSRLLICYIFFRGQKDLGKQVLNFLLKIWLGFGCVFIWETIFDIFPSLGLLLNYRQGKASSLGFFGIRALFKWNLR